MQCSVLGLQYTEVNSNFFTGNCIFELNSYSYTSFNVLLICFICFMSQLKLLLIVCSFGFHVIDRIYWENQP